MNILYQRSAHKINDKKKKRKIPKSLIKLGTTRTFRVAVDPSHTELLY